MIVRSTASKLVYTFSIDSCANTAGKQHFVQNLQSSVNSVHEQ